MNNNQYERNRVRDFLYHVKRGHYPFSWKGLWIAFWSKGI